MSRNSLLATFHYLRTLKYCPDDLSHPALNPLFKLSAGSPGEKGRALEDESRILGFCISASPLQYFREELDRFSPTGSSAFRDVLNSIKRKHPVGVCCAGMVLNRRVEKTKDGSRMLFCTIEDRDGIFEAVFFPAFYQKYMKTLSECRVLIIRGVLKYRDGDVTVIGKEAIDPAVLKRLNLSYRKESIKQDILIESGQVWKKQER